MPARHLLRKATRDRQIDYRARLSHKAPISGQSETQGRSELTGDHLVTPKLGITGERNMTYVQSFLSYPALFLTFLTELPFVF
jgi:hypothetical protein